MSNNEMNAREYFASFAKGDPDAIAAFVSPDFVNTHAAGLGSGCEGRAVYRERLEQFLADMVGLNYTVEHVIDDPDRGEVAVFYTMHARWQDEAEFSVHGAQRLVFANGLITERNDYWDSAVFLAQVDERARTMLEGFGVCLPR